MKKFFFVVILLLCTPYAHADTMRITSPSTIKKYLTELWITTSRKENKSLLQSLAQKNRTFIAQINGLELETDNGCFIFEDDQDVDKFLTRVRNNPGSSVEFYYIDFEAKYTKKIDRKGNKECCLV